MRVPCFLRAFREQQTKTLRDIEAETGIARGQLSLYEQGRQLVRDEHQLQLEEAYGAPAHEWYPPALLLLIERDEQRGAAIVEARARVRDRSAA